MFALLGEEAKDAASAKNDAVIMAAINEEVAIFNAELEEHKLRSKINIHVSRLHLKLTN